MMKDEIFGEIGVQPEALQERHALKAPTWPSPSICTHFGCACDWATLSSLLDDPPLVVPAVERRVPGDRGTKVHSAVLP